MRDLPTIPMLDATGRSPAALVREAPDQVDALLRSATARYSPVGLRLGDLVSRRWLTRNANPYLPEIQETARVLGRSGAFLLNVSYEWACTTGTRPASDGGQLLVRVLDWDLAGLGRNLCAIRRSGPAGEWIDIGWPGFSGAITGIAPGRFAAAINQPPLPGTATGRRLGRASPFLGKSVDWVASRGSVWRSRALTPAHLLRLAFDTAEDWSQAVALLSERPISTNAFFTVAGPGPGQGCVIERTPGAAAVRRANPVAAVANHWVAMQATGFARGHASEDRLRQCEALLKEDADPFGLRWMQAPILNNHTRLAAVCDPATGRTVVQGWEVDGPATRLLDIPG